MPFFKPTTLAVIASCVTAATAQTWWQPPVGASWQIVLRDPIDVSRGLTPMVDVYDLDLFDNDKKTFDYIHSRGKKVICYFSAGSSEDWRDDFDDFNPKTDFGKPLDGWAGESWLNVRSANVRKIMTKRMDVAVQKGCDAIDPDNVDGFQNDNGVKLTKKDSIDYIKFLAAEAHKRKLSIGLKNAADIVLDVLPFVDFQVNEECADYDECEVFEAFIDDDKPVFHIEYPPKLPKFGTKEQSKRCDAPGADKFSTLIKRMELDGYVRTCEGKVYTTRQQK